MQTIGSLMASLWLRLSSVFNRKHGQTAPSFTDPCSHLTVFKVVLFSLFDHVICEPCKHVDMVHLQVMDSFLCVFLIWNVFFI